MQIHSALCGPIMDHLHEGLPIRKDLSLASSILALDFLIVAPGIIPDHL